MEGSSRVSTRLIFQESTSGENKQPGEADEMAEVKDIASKVILNQPAASSLKSLSDSVTSPAGVQVKLDHKSLAPGGPDHSIAMERKEEYVLLAKPEAEFYDKIIAGLSNKENFDHEAVKKAVDMGLQTLRSLAGVGVEGLTVQLGESDHIILFIGKNDEEKFTDYSGKAQPTADDVDFIAKGTFGLVQKAGRKVLKTIRQDKGPEAKQDIKNAISNLKSLHAAHPDGKVPNLEATPKHILVAVIDPKTNEISFIDGALSPHYEDDLDSIGPDDEANFPDMHLVLGGYADVFGTLAFMHAQEMPHGDLKPGNIYIRDGKFYLGDFGSVRRVSEWNEDNYLSGTTQYMSVEDAAKFVRAFEEGDVEAAKTIREKMDVFALAASAFKTVTGCDVYGDLYPPSYQDPLYVDPSHLADDGADILDAIADQYKPEVKEFLLKALSPNREERPSAAECQAMLRAILTRS